MPKVKAKMNIHHNGKLVREGEFLTLKDTEIEALRDAVASLEGNSPPLEGNSSPPDDEQPDDEIAATKPDEPTTITKVK
jgi:hypothetical protein